jgi:hypothetical protein
MEATKILTAIDDVLVLDPAESINGAVGVQYGAGGAGTIILEGKVGDAQAAWLAIGMKSYTDGSAIANLAATGGGYAECVGLDIIRVRKTVAGPGDVLVSINYQPG